MKLMWKWLNASAGYLSIIIGMAAVSMSVIVDKEINVNSKNATVLAAEFERELYAKQVTELESSVLALEEQLIAFKNLPAEQPVSLKLVEIELKLEQVESKVDALNNAILNSPEKALSLPLLRKDLEALKSQYIQSTESLEQQVVQAYDMFKWITGTLFLSVATLAMGTLVKSKRE